MASSEEAEIDPHSRFESGLSEGLRDFRDLFGLPDPAGGVGTVAVKAPSGDAGESRRSKSGSRRSRVPDPADEVRRQLSAKLTGENGANR